MNSQGSFAATSFNSLACGCDSCPTGIPNLTCFSGTGTYTGSSGTVDVAYRVELEDATPDEYRIWIYIPKTGETKFALAVDICCHNPDTDVANPAAETFAAGRTADIFDGGTVSQGDIRIRPQIASHEGSCPAGTMCPLPLP